LFAKNAEEADPTRGAGPLSTFFLFKKQKRSRVSFPLLTGKRVFNDNAEGETDDALTIRFLLNKNRRKKEGK